MNAHQLAALGYFGMGQVEGPRGVGAPSRLAGPSRAALGAQYQQAMYAPVGSDRQIPGYPYGMRGMGDDRAMVPADANYPPAPVPQGLPAQSYWQLPPAFTHTYGYKDALAAAGLEFHTEVFDLAVDPVQQSGANIAAGASVIATVRISQEADFVEEKRMVAISPSTALFTVQIFDNATNRALSNVALRGENAAGTAQRPRLVKPRLYRRNSDISLVFTNVGAVTITALQWLFSGFKIFSPDALNLNNPQ